MLQETEPAAVSPPLCHVPESPVYQVYCIRSILHCTVLYCTVLYQVYATIVAFYLPLTVIIILNTQIYVIARRIISRVRQDTWHVVFITVKTAAGEEEPQLVAAPAGGEPRGDGRHHGHRRHPHRRQAQAERGRARGRAGEEGGCVRDQHTARHGQR